MYKFLFFLMLLTFWTCQRPLWKSKLKGFSTYNKGEFWYQWHGNDANAIKPKEGDQVQIDYTILKDTTVLQSSFGQSETILVQIPNEQYDNFFTKALKLMAAGDSLHIKIRAADIPDLLGEHASKFGAEDWVDFYYKCYIINDKVTVAKERAVQEAAIAAIQNQVATLIKQYKTDETIDGIQVRPSQLKYIPLKKNEKKDNPKAGDIVSIHYICYHPDGFIIDQSFANMQPLEFELPSTNMIDGLSEAVTLLSEGESALFIIPPHLAYGETGSGELIPPNATIFFYIELLTIN